MANAEESTFFFWLKHLFKPLQVLMICWPESALLTTMLAALGVVTNLQSNGDTGPTFYSRPNLYWWYMPPMYIHKGGGGRLF